MVSFINDVSAWMKSNRLQLNTAKTELMWCAPSRQQYLIAATPLLVDNNCLTSDQCSKPGDLSGLGHVNENSRLKDHVLLLQRVATCVRSEAFGGQSLTVSKPVLLSLASGYITCPDTPGLWKHQPRWHILIDYSQYSTQLRDLSVMVESTTTSRLCFVTYTSASSSAAYQVSSGRSRLPLSKQNSTRVLVERLAVGSRGNSTCSPADVLWKGSRSSWNPC